MKYKTILLLLLAALGTACNKATAYEKPLTPVRVIGAQKFQPTGSDGAGTRYSATIRPAAPLDLAFKTGGYLRELLQVRGADGRLRSVQEGDWVAQSTVLARLREDDFSNKLKAAESQVAEATATLNTAQAQLAEAEAASKQAQRDLERATALLEANSLTRPEFDAAKTRYETTQAKVEAARAQTQVINARINSAKTVLAEAQLAKGDAVIRAPFDCFVLKRNAEAGALVAPGVPLITLTESASVKAVFGVPDVTVAKLKQGTALTLTTEALPGLEFRGWITRIAAAADARTRVFEVELTIPRPPSQLRAGMIASLLVTDGQAETRPAVTVVPLNAIVSDPNKPGSYTVVVVRQEQGKAIAHRRVVKLGEAYGNLVAVTEGIEAGDQVVIVGAALVKESEQVKVTE
jgi:RND family efflux transporter MFP subunit